MLAPEPRHVSFSSALVPTWLVTAVWDAVCVTALGVLAYGTSAAAPWRGVASMLPGAAALDGGAAAVVAGLAVHSAVALAWSALSLAAVRASPALRRVLGTPTGALAIATAFGPLIWMVMSLAIIPLATGRPPRIGASWWMQLAVHIPSVTIPLVFTARHVLGDAPLGTPVVDQATRVAG